MIYGRVIWLGMEPDSSFVCEDIDTSLRSSVLSAVAQIYVGFRIWI
jgi:hypothetical protein